ncbi:toll/interleukin-1 receptor (TIR) domain-containing protein [Artemisia annua]|uniref:Toll/interleukin-1 receptor (TIR) domain-containing protein n=1 Tax=Artemisia annua TaxID=35608 RepID=A0A2U1MEI3_ARTAN|nr:toll/interleukin-1 receptor (TIR) domain-containing protein [Artemisia annua]
MKERRLNSEKPGWKEEKLGEWSKAIQVVSGCVSVGVLKELGCFCASMGALEETFRGIDTRNTFTAHLHQALKEANYETFYDDEEIEFGKPLKQKLVNGIKASKSSVVVLSENYASSTWCLEELVLILEQLANSDHYVFPIFYHVKPSDIGKQLNSFADAMEKHKQRMEDETSAERKSEWVQNMVKWKKALEQVSKLKGKEPKDRYLLF